MSVTLKSKNENKTKNSKVWLADVNKNEQFDEIFTTFS